jgi:hypothetical protein
VTGELLHNALGETEELLAGLLADEAGADIQAAVDQVLLANGWPGRPHVIGSIQTRRTRTVHAPDGHRAALTEVVTRALIEAARRRRDRLQGKPNSGYDPLFNGAAPVQPGAREGGAEDTTLADLICDRL